MNEAQRQLAMQRAPVIGMTEDFAERFNGLVAELKIVDDAISNDALTATMAALSKKVDLTAQLNQTATFLLDELITDSNAVRTLRSLGDRLVIGALALLGVSAFTQRLDDDSYLIAVGHGLAQLTSFGCQVFSLSPQALPWIRQRRLHFREPGTSAARMIRLGLAPIVVGDADGLVPPLLTDTASAQLWGAALVASDGFLLCHEFAHIILGHISTSDAGTGLQGRSAERYQKEEIEADQLAARLLFSDMEAGKAHELDPELRVMGVQLHLQMMSLYERAAFLTAPRTHPPAEFRWQEIRRQVLQPLLGERTLASLWRHYRRFLAPLILIAPQVASIRDDADIVYKRCRNVINVPLWDQEEWTSYARIHHDLRQSAESARRRLIKSAARRGLPAETIDRALAYLSNTPQIVELREVTATGEGLTRSVLHERVISALAEAQAPFDQLPPADFVPLLGPILI